MLARNARPMSAARPPALDVPRSAPARTGDELAPTPHPRSRPAPPHRAPPTVAPLLLAALLLTLAAPARADDADHVRLTLSGPATPYAAVTWEVARERGAVVVGLEKRFAPGFGHRAEVGLLTDADLNALLDALAALGAFTLPARTVETPRTVYTLSIQQGRRRHRVTVHDPEWSPDPRARAVFARIRAAVAAHTDPIPFRDALVLPGEYGTLHLRATPPATVALDGVPLEGRTPITDLRLTTGRHRLTLTPLSGGEARDYDVTIEPGKTTSLVVELR